MELDALRGAALAGIVMVNIVQMTGVTRPDGPAAAHPGAFGFELLFLQRPFPVFTFLFGVGFAMLLCTASRLVLLRRLLWLGVFAALHTLLQPNEVLKYYTVYGIAVLLPASFLPRRWTLVLGIAYTATVGVTLGGVYIIPGLFLLGMATARYGLPETLAGRGGQLLTAFGVALPCAALMGWEQYRHGVGPSAQQWTLAAGLFFAFLYTVGLLLVMRTPARRLCTVVLAPMGRLALTNYVLASALILAADAVFRVGESRGYGTVVAVGAGIGAVQAVLSVGWLRFFRQGPLEWAWRSLTYWRPVPLR